MEYLIQKETLVDIADNIRRLTDTTEDMAPEEMKDLLGTLEEYE